MRCLIVDDEAPARLEMRRLLSAHPRVEVVGEAGDVRTALELYSRLRPELIFLDIQLRGETGFDFVAAMGEGESRVVFVTAYDQHALRGFECNALDYLLKPVHPERLKSTLERLVPPATPAEDEPLLLKDGSTSRLVPWPEILRVVSEGNYTRVHLEGGDSMLILRPLKEWQTLAPKGLFCRVHRTVLIQRRGIREIRALSDDKREILATDGIAIPVSRSFWPTLKTWISRR
jgi:two-component system LytT family response regulator